MTARAAVLLASVVAAAALVACSNTLEIPVETPIQPKIDTSPFERVLVAGFVAGGSEDVDGNLETVRLLRSQLRTKSNLKVIEADPIPLAEMMADQGQAAGNPAAPAIDPKLLPRQIKDEKDLEAYDPLFANAAYWKKIGEEFQGPLIVTGSLLFTPNASSGFVQRDREVIDQYGRRTVEPVRTYMERKGYVLRPKFVFIDGRTGKVIDTEVFREAVLYNQGQETPALSSYFELMDRIVPAFLGTLASQKIRGTRVLLR
jgi:hypothetical protein